MRAAAMSSANSFAVSSKAREIEYLSPPAQVSMADRWFEIASPDHFWVRRRFKVLRRLCAGLIGNAKEMAEIGCGHGLLQKQIETEYKRQVSGFDLNEFALKQNISEESPLFCYDIFQMESALKGKFDVIFMFDVIEHISEEDKFLNAVLFHLAPQGSLIINVPAGKWAFSPYDTAAGHVRRYAIRTLRDTAQRSQLVLKDWTYWGLPLVPSLLLRKLWLMGKSDQGSIITSGFDTRSSLINQAMGALSQLEWIPQKVLGTSLMGVLRRRSA
jgi:SAM-dependent methyltransferase